MTHGIRMHCFDDECDPQCMRLYIHIEKCLNGSIDICVMRFGSACMKGTNQVQIFVTQTLVLYMKTNSLILIERMRDEIIYPNLIMKTSDDILI